MANWLSILNTQLKRYQILERLGVGGMATVYKARDTNLGREVAIKILHEHLIHDATFKERFEREARLVASFNHPNIVQVYDFDVIETDGNKLYYMVMPFLQGQTLADLIEEFCAKDETMPHEQIQKIVSDIASALDYAHAREMVHRDVKPSNIMFDEYKHAILTDFGIARLAQSSNLTQEDAIIGTPAYMSPEQALGQELDYRSDLYALGIIIYEMLTGHVPFEDESSVALLVKHAQEEAPPVSQFLPMKNPALDKVLAKILQKNPDSRYQSGVSLLADFKKAVASETEDDRLKPGTLPQLTDKPTPAKTQLLTDTKEETPNRLTHTINTIIIKPARQNPLGFIALGIAIFALLIVARLSQMPIANTSNPTDTPIDTEVNSMTSMTGAGAMYFSSSFEQGDKFNSYWEVSDGTVERHIENGTYHIRNTQTGLAVTGIIDPEVFMFEGVHISMEGRLTQESDSHSAYGIVFDYHDAKNLYVFAVDGIGRFSIWKLADNVWCELRFPCEGQDFDTVWTRNEAILLRGETNTLTINAYDGQITGYVNDESVFMIDDSTFTSGGVGIYTASSQAGIADTLIDSYEVSAGMPLTGSMTGDG